MMIGKVHGGLSRAGKVKGQTPKVEPKEKRKPKVGRSKTRLLYAYAPPFLIVASFVIF